MRFQAMKEMCADCPFGHTEAQIRMRESLRPGRFEEIAQAVWTGSYFPCHKTTHFDDDGDAIAYAGELQCKGALEFIERVSENRRRRGQ